MHAFYVCIPYVFYACILCLYSMYAFDVCDVQFNSILGPAVSSLFMLVFGTGLDTTTNITADMFPNGCADRVPNIFSYIVADVHANVSTSSTPVPAPLRPNNWKTTLASQDQSRL